MYRESLLTHYRLNVCCLPSTARSHFMIQRMLFRLLVCLLISSRLRPCALTACRDFYLTFPFFQPADVCIYGFSVILSTLFPSECKFFYTYFCSTVSKILKSKLLNRYKLWRSKELFASCLSQTKSQVYRL